uniref:Histone-lysine N-methyltransferase n=1 Tax=Globisporangium ultimum (strain ATCC 200006 / CBS 805.95 / DAOM BR144) TaxID=431595 RepID=K3WGT8_GLOUD
MVQRRSSSWLSVSASPSTAGTAAAVAVAHGGAVKRFSKRTAEALLKAANAAKHVDSQDELYAALDAKEHGIAVDADGDDKSEMKSVESEENSVFTSDTQQFLDALKRDVLRKWIPRPFELPFSKSEIKNLEARKLEYRPPHYGKISKCVFVSKPAMPNAELPVHKCNCFAETKVVSTKRETQIASTKLLKENGGKRRLRTSSVSSSTKSPSKKAPSAEGSSNNNTAQMLCGENCHNRMLFISCSDDTCSAPDPSLCSNRAIKRREVKSVRVEYIPGPGFGLIAAEPIKAGEFVIEYVGEVIDDEECERRMIQYRDRGETHFYMLELDKDTLIDARYRSNESRFINHSCDSNSMTQKWNVDGMLRIGIFARRNISVDEEITIDYNFSHFGEAVDCKCGSSACTGKIGRKRSEMVKFVKGVPVSTLAAARAHSNSRQGTQEAQDIVPAEIQRPIQVTSLALLKSAQLDTEWLNFPVSEWSSAPEDDAAASTLTESFARTAAATTKKPLAKSDWYERVKEGKHLPEMRARPSYICGGKSDWSKDLGALNAAAAQRGRSSKAQMTIVMPTKTSDPVPVKKLNAKRLSLLEARTRLFADLIAFANGTSKWNAKIPSSTSLNPDRIFRFIEHTKNGKRVHNNDLNDLSDDTCNRCGGGGELICCDGCPAAFHLCCTNLVMIPPANVDWFCSNCTNPKATHAKPLAAAEDGAAAGDDSNAVRRQLRTHAAPLVPSLKRFNSNSQHLVKKKYKKRAKAVDRSYRMLEQMPLPVIADSDEDD